MVKPSSRARQRDRTTRSLNECVGLRASFLTHTSPSPSRSASRSARTSGCSRREARAARLAGAGRRRRPAAGSRRSARCSGAPPVSAAGARHVVESGGRGRSHLERAEAALADEVATEGVLRPAFLATQRIHGHEKNLCPGLAHRGSRRPPITSPRLSWSWSGNWHRFPPPEATKWLPGLHRASPSKP